MRYLWYCEIKKLVCNKNFILVLLFFIMITLAANIFCINVPIKNEVTSKNLSSCYDVYEGKSIKDVENQIIDRMQRLECRAEVEKLMLLTGELRESMVEELKTKWGLTESELRMFNEPLLYSDNIEDELLLMDVVYQYVAQINNYPNYIQGICERSKAIQESTLYKENAYSIQAAEQTKLIYEKLQDLQLSVVNPVGIEIAIGNWIDDVLRVLFCCMSGMFFFQLDKENGLFSLFFSTQNGRKKAYWCKICAALLCNVLFCIITLCIQFGVGYIWCGMANFELPIQTIPAYYKSPYRLTIGDLIYINGIVKIWNVVVLTIVTSVFYISLEFIFAWAGIIMTFIFSVALYIGVSESSVLHLFKYMNLASFSQTENLVGDLIYLKIGSIPLSYQSGMFIVTLGIVLIGLQIGKCNFKYQIPTRRLKLRQRKKVKRKTSSLLALEIKKLIRPHIGLLVLGISIAAQVMFYSGMCSGIGFEERILESRLKQLEGVYSEDAHEMLLQEMEEVQNGQRIYSDAQIRCLDKLLSISQYLENANSNTEVYYVYSGAYEALAGIRKVSISYQNIGITLSLCLLLVGIFVQEKKDGMYFLNHTTLNRRKIYREKILLVIVISTFVCIFWWLPECIYIFQNFYVSNPFVPAVSVQVFSNCPSWMMIWEVVAIVWLMRILASIQTGLLIAFSSYMAKNYMMAWFGSGILIAVQWAGWVILYGIMSASEFGKA